MTPLSLKIARDTLLPARKRQFRDEAHIGRHLGEAQYFELSEVYEAMHSLAVDIGRQLLQKRYSDLAFLPAPVTWLEWKGPQTPRLAWVLVDRGVTADVYVIAGDIESRFVMAIPLRDQLLSQEPSELMITVAPTKNGTRPGLFAENYPALLAALALINTPRIIGRRQHMPHRGLEKRLLRDRANIGRFPAGAWTEIKLAITPPKDMADGNSIEAHYTGSKALHFCRAHLRVRCGRIEVVRGHWRGDASLGIKRSRYKLVPQR
jgi:hypothetical protein